MWPRKVGEKYANAWGCMQPQALAYFPPIVLGHTAQKSRGKVCQCMGLHKAPVLAYVSPTPLGHMAQNKLRENKYANAWGLHANPCISILSPYFFWATWPRHIGENYVNAWRMQPHALEYLSSTVLGHMAQHK